MTDFHLNHMRETFLFGQSRLLGAVTQLAVGPPETLMEEARQVFEEMAPTLPYRNDSEHMMATALFAGATCLAIFQVLRMRGISAHVWGNAILSASTSAHATNKTPPAETALEARLKIEEEAKLAKTKPVPNGFSFEVVSGSANFDFGYDVTHCPVADLFKQYDAQALLAYICATDDLMSKQLGQGLTRTGTIATGANKCDFRYLYGASPKTLAERYPELYQELIT